MNEQKFSLSSIYKLESYYRQLPEKEKEAHCVRETCLFNILASIFYFQSIDKASAKFILESLVKNKPPFLYQQQDFTIATSTFQWLSHCIAEFFDIKIGIDVSNLLLTELANISPNLQQFVQAFQDPNTRDRVPSAEIQTIMINLYKHLRPLFHGLYPTFEKYIVTANKNNVLRKLNYDSLNFLPQSLFTISDFQFEETEQARILFSQYSLYTDTSFIKKLQKDFFSQNPFPMKTFFGGNSSLAGLMNTAASTGSSIIDLTLNGSLPFFKQGNVQKVNEYLYLFPELKPIGLIAVLNSKTNDHHWLSQTLSGLGKITNPKPIFVQFVERVSNDIQLMKKIKEITGQTKSIEELQTKSIPLIFKLSLESFHGDIFDIIRNSQYYAFSDSDKEIDFDFACAYFALAKTIQQFKQENEDDYTIIDNSLKNISNSEIQQQCLIDIFSLLFLQKKEQDQNSASKFVCSSLIAERIIPMLLGIAQSPELVEIIKQAQKRVMISNILLQNANMETAMQPVKSTLFTCLMKREWAIAEDIASNLEELSTFYQIYKDTVLDAPLDNNPNKLILMCERSLSQKKDFKLLPDIIYNDETPNDVKQIATKRYDQQDLIFSLFKPTNIIFKDISAKLLRLTAASWPAPTDLGELKNSSPYLASFMHYLDSLIPALLLANPNKTIGELLLFSPDKIVANLLQNGCFEEASKVAHLMNMDIIEAILKYMPNEVEESAPYLQKYPVVQIVNALLNNVLPSAIYSKSIARFIDYREKLKHEAFENHKLESFNNSPQYAITNRTLINNTKTLTIDDLNNTSKKLSDFEDYEQNGIPENLLIEKLKRYLHDSASSAISKAKEIDPELLEDISYRISNDTFSQIISEALPTLNIQSLFKALQICVCDDKLYGRVKLLAEISSSTGVAPYPLKHSLSLLLKIKNYQLAKQFIEMFRYEVNCVSILREEVLNLLHGQNDASEILEIYPPLKQEIIASLPPRFQTQILQSFQSFFSQIPDTWKVEKDPQSTCKANIEQPEFQEIMKKFPQIDLSKELMQMITSKISPNEVPIVYKLSYISEFVKQYASCFRIQIQLSKFVSKMIYSYISSLVVDQPAMESLAREVMTKASVTINECVQIFKKLGNNDNSILDLQQKISALRKFINCSFHVRFNVEYSFSNFTSEDLCNVFSEICLRYDEFDVASKMAKAWNCDCNDLRDAYSRKVVDLGLYEEALKLSVDRNETNPQKTYPAIRDSISHYQLCSWVDRALVSELITKGIPPDVEIFVDEFIQQDLIGSSSLFQSAAETSSERPSDGFPDERIRELQTLPSTINAFKSFESPHNHRKQRVYQSPIMMRKSNDFEVAIKHSLQGSTYSNLPQTQDIDIVPHFYYRLFAITKNLISSTPSPEAFSALNKYLEQHCPPTERSYFLVKNRSFKVPFTLLQQERTTQSKWNIFFNSIFIPALSFRSLDMLKQCIREQDPKLEVFGPLMEQLLLKSQKRNLDRLSFDIEMFLGLTEKALLTAQDLFKNAETTKECINCLDMIDRCLSGNDSEEFVKLVEGVKLQKEFCYICVENDITDCRSMNIFGEIEAKISVTAYLFKNLKFKLGMDVLKYTGINPRLVANRIADILSNESPETIDNFVKEFEQSEATSQDKRIFSEFIHMIVMRIAYEHNHLELSMIVIKSLKDAYFRCALLLQFDNTSEAFADAKANQIIELMPSIANLAFHQGKQQIVDEAMKILSKHYK